MFLYNQDLSCFLILPIKWKRRFSFSLGWVDSEANQCRRPFETLIALLCMWEIARVYWYIEILVWKGSTNMTVTQNVRVLQKLLAFCDQRTTVTVFVFPWQTVFVQNAIVAKIGDISCPLVSCQELTPFSSLFQMKPILEAKAWVWCCSCEPYRDCCMFCYLNWKYNLSVKQFYSVLIPVQGLCFSSKLTSEALKQYILLGVWNVSAAQDHSNHGWYELKNILFLMTRQISWNKNSFHVFLFNLYLIAFLQFVAYSTSSV